MNTMDTMEQKLKRYKKLLDSNEYVTNRYRRIFENEYETLLRKYLDKPVLKNVSICCNESTHQERLGAEYEFPISNKSTYQEPSPAERAKYEFN